MPPTASILSYFGDEYQVIELCRTCSHGTRAFITRKSSNALRGFLRYYPFLPEAIKLTKRLKSELRDGELELM